MDFNTEVPTWSALSGALEKTNHPSARKTNSSKIHRLKIICVPLSDLLTEMSWNAVDFFSLDAEGSDFDILQSFPWTDIHIRVGSTVNCF